MPVRVLVVAGNPKPASRTLALADEVARQVGGVLAASDGEGVVEVDRIDLAELAPELFDWGSARVEAAVADVRAAEVLVVASPTYKATYTGLLKAFLDRIPAGALAGVPCIPVMVGGDTTHALAVEVHLRPLLVELGATCPTAGLYVTEDQLADMPAVVAAWLITASPALSRSGQP